ncbi:iron-sulfur cluster biosynthesis transcriptional regulator SufR [Romeria aff. gracilis LEGE 07310]|uniref:Iron-sulfur cluster biosynthesis transcriptional regulator SufR n=2 Tax=Vasconcelosia TaxID=3366328 RepID=A0A8J7AAY8_9CYAN|nr:iron-sulfur cluster biosynthesis transcriptional regulator SufR [Romeria aff. gracilis LEGE 07310]
MTSAQQPSTNPSTKEVILRFLLKQGEATVQEIAVHLEVSPQAIRRHLKDLESEALIEHQTVQEGIGRPNHRYQLSRKGRDSFPAQYDQFALSLLNTLTETVGPEHVSTILHQQWQSKAQAYRARLGDAPLEQRVQSLVKLRQEEGYMAEWHVADHPYLDAPAAAPEGTSETRASAFVITEYNCAISHIAESYPGICGHELSMFAVALPDCSVERTHWLVDGEHQCGYLIYQK